MEGSATKRKRDAVPKDKKVINYYDYQHYTTTTNPTTQDDNPKQLWLMTFGSSSPDVTIEMLEACGVKTGVNAIHNATWRESKYTLLSLSRKGRMRGSQVNALVKKLSADHNMVSSEIMGYESITGNVRKSDDSIPLHPGFKLMVDFLQTGKGDGVRSWTKEKEETHAKRKGYLQRHAGTSDIDAMTKAQLQTTCHALKKIVDETEPIRSTYTTLQVQLDNAEARLAAQTEELHATRVALRRAMAQIWEEMGTPGDTLRALIVACGCTELLDRGIRKDLEPSPEELANW